MNRKYIFFDIDNTLVSHAGGTHIPPQTLEAVHLLRENGHVPAIATGRGAFLTRPTAQKFSIDTMVCSGGAQVISAGKTIFEAWLSDSAFRSFMRTVELYPLETAAADDDFLYYDTADDETRKYFASQAGYDCVKNIDEAKRAHVCYIMMGAPLDGDCGIFTSPPDDVFLENMHSFVEARPAGTSKWRGIETMMKHIGADIDDVITFGDGPNDVDMLRSAPLGIAVGNACDEARAAADIVCDDIDSGGILTACRELGLI